MKSASIALIAILFSGCNSTGKFPTEFAGTWTFHVSSLYKEIEEKNLPEDEEKALKFAFGATEKNQTCTVTKQGVFRYPQLPKGVHIQLTVVSRSEIGYVFKEQNSMNPSAAEYSLNQIENGIWKSTLTDRQLEPVHPELPNTYWAKSQE